MVVGMAGTKVPKSLSFRLRVAKIADLQHVARCGGEPRFVGGNAAFRLGCLDNLRKENREYCPGLPRCRPAAHSNAASMFPNDSQGEPQPETRSPVFLRGVKRFKQVFELLRANPAAAITHKNPDACAFPASMLSSR
jgi:hypothetical protein